jgi:hypothetical protein
MKPFTFNQKVTGYSHLYTYNLKTKIKKQLTKGDWEFEVRLSKDKSVLFNDQHNNPGNRDFINWGFLVGFTTNFDKRFELMKDTFSR